MYASLSLKRLSSFLGVTFGAALVLMLLLRGTPSDIMGWVRTFSLTLTYWSLALVALFGWSGKLSPWRGLWYAIPQLNHWVFPDLNGKWFGSAQSNWTVIETLIEAAERKRPKVERDDLANIPLKNVEVILHIRASLFTFRIHAKLEDTKGTSHSLTERVQKNEARDTFELYYVYLQHTPQPQLTDEASHPGAARLDLDLDRWTMAGEYWNRRSWRSGFNAAGLLNVRRVDRGGWFK